MVSKNFELEQVNKFRLFSQGQGVILGPGDDAAVLKMPDSQAKNLVFCGDMVIENVHFDRKQLSFKEVGRKAVARTLSDIAAMASSPLYMGFSLALPKEDRQYIDAIMEGARELLADFDCDLVGGDISKGTVVICDTWCVGQVDCGKHATRSGAKTGDCIFVAGKLGGSYESKHHANFRPQIDLANSLAKRVRINSMIDISDGLVFDLYRIIDDSNKSALIHADKIPLNENCNIENALYDGEDYVLLFTVDPQYSEQLVNEGFYCIGEIKEGDVELYLKLDNKERLLEREGFSSLS